jgi:hypothetical protein
LLVRVKHTHPPKQTGGGRQRGKIPYVLCLVTGAQQDATDS